MRKKICILAPVHIYSDVRVFKKEAMTLSEFYDVVLYARIEKEETFGAIRVKPVVYKNRIERLCITPFQLLKCALLEKADVYHLHNPETIPVGIFLKLFRKIVVYDTHENFKKLILRKKWLPAPLRKMIAELVHGAEIIAHRVFDTMIVTQEEQVKTSFPNALLIENPPIIDKKNCNASVICEKNTYLRLIYVGEITHDRGIDLMYDLVEHLNVVCQTPTRLWLIGAGENWKKEVEGHRAEQWVDCLGYITQERAFDYLKQSDFGLILFRPVGDNMDINPNKLFEYMSFGVPFVASAFPLWMQRIESIESGIFTEPENMSEMSSKILELYKDSLKYKLVALAGYTYVKHNYNWSQESVKLNDNYATLIGRES